MKIALTGNPNSGKTTTFNALTGRNERVGNWAGVTVDKKEAPISKKFYDCAEELIAVDLPGCLRSKRSASNCPCSGFVFSRSKEANEIEQRV